MYYAYTCQSLNDQSNLTKFNLWKIYLDESYLNKKMSTKKRKSAEEVPGPLVIDVIALRTEQ